MKVTNFENKMLKVIAKYHAYSYTIIENIYLKLQSFDKVIRSINYADEYNRDITYMYNLYI